MSESEVGTLSKKIDDMHSNKNPKFNSNYTSFWPTNSQTIKEDIDPNEGTYMNPE